MFRKVIVLCLASLLSTGAHADVPTGFIRDWLICGPFPNPPNKEVAAGEDNIYDHTPPCVGLDTDYLVEHGGESKIVPEPGMSHTKKDGTKVSWFEHVSNLDKVVFRKAITKEWNVVGYAYRCIEVDEEGSYLLALGSDEGVRVWVNGEQVHDHLVERRINADDDLVPVTFKEGKNHLLIKVEQGWGGWGFILRIVPQSYVFSTHDVDTGRMDIKLSLKKRASKTAEKMQLFAADKVVAEGEFAGEDEGGLAEVDLVLPFPPVGEEYGNLRVVVNGREACTVEMPLFGKARADTFKWQTPRGYPGCVFSGTELPRIDFERPLWVEKLIGPYEISATYYDADHNEVTSADAPGRYGAVVDIKSALCNTRRFVTLYRQQEEFNWWDHELKGRVALPKGLGVSSAVASDYEQHVNRFVKDQLAEGLARDQGGAILLSALHEAEADGVACGYYTSPGLRDRGWWLPLKRKLYGMDKTYPKPFVCPRKIQGKPARAIREGTWREAGVTESFAVALDQHLTTWANDTDEAFGVIVVRHGVIAFHKAYGDRDGEPMTLETKSWMASITKMMSGTLIMMLVDQGLLSLDDRADQHLPPLRGISKPWPATIRNLYRHTAGMDGHWGSWFSDMEYRVADMAPYYEHRVRYNYDGAGLDLSCKILELISGETLPEFFRNHLFKPLGCENTDVDNACGAANSTPLDMAKICQMLLQKGAYGDMRFFSEDVFKQMLPTPLGDVLNPPWWSEVGIGTGFCRTDGLGEGTFGHGAASQAYVRIDPVNDMVIVMTRNRAGRNFDKYTKGFFQTIVEGLVNNEEEEE